MLDECVEIMNFLNHSPRIQKIFNFECYTAMILKLGGGSQIFFAAVLYQNLHFGWVFPQSTTWRIAIFYRIRTFVHVQDEKRKITQKSSKNWFQFDFAPSQSWYNGSFLKKKSALLIVTVTKSGQKFTHRQISLPWISSISKNTYIHL